MADEQSPNEQGDSADGTELISEMELDLVLSRAATLAAELSEHVGLPAPSYTPATAAGDSPSDLELDLAELERLVDSADAEIAEPAEQESAVAFDAAEKPPPEAAAPADLAVPDFMSEFTESPPEAAAPAGVPQPTIADTEGGGAEPAPGVVGSPAFGVVGTPVPASPSDATEDGVAAEVEAPAVEEVPEVAESKLKKVREMCAKMVASVSGKVAPMAAGVCDRGVSLLEKADAPFQKLTDLPRRIIGWVALATLGTALIVLAITAF